MLAETTPLRPLYTKELLGKLMSGQSLNLIGVEEQGTERLLEDLKATAPADVDVALLDMRQHRRDIAGFLRAVQEEIATAGRRTKKTTTKKVAASSAGTNLNDLLYELDQRKRRLILLLNNFDSMLELKAEYGYGIDYFSALNSIRNRGQIGLLCVTRAPWLASRIEIEAKKQIELVSTSSVLDLTPEMLPAMTYEQIRDEFGRAGHDPESLVTGRLCAVVQNDARPYMLLKFLRDLPAAEYQDAPDLGALLKQRQQDFNALHPPRWRKNLSPTYAGHVFNEIVRKFDILFKDVWGFVRNHKIATGGIAGVITGGISSIVYFVWEFISKLFG